MARLLKVLVPLFLFLLSTTSLIVHKVACVDLFHLLKAPDVTPQTRILGIACILLLPLLLSLLHMLWYIPILARPQYAVVPSARKLFGDLFACTLETVSMAGVANVLLTTSLSVVDVLLLSAPVMVFQLFKEFASDIKMSTIVRKAKKFIRCTAKTPFRLLLVLQCVVMPALYVIRMHAVGVIGLSDAVILVTSVSVLSFTWSRSLGIDSTDSNIVKTRRRTHYLYIMFKIIVTFIVISLISIQFRHQFELGSETANMNKRSDLLFGLLTLLASAIFFKCLAFVSTMLCQTVCGLYLPSAVSTIVVAVAALSARTTTVNPLLAHDMGHLFIQTSIIVCVITVYILGWRVFSRLPQALMASYDQIFNGYGWNFLLLDIETILSVYTGRKAAKVDNVVRLDSKPTIFVCVTMFRETKHEMSTLINSLRKLAESWPCSMPSPYFHFHVFFDDGCRKGDLTRYASQFLKLLNSHKIGTDYMYRTAYGLQYQNVFLNSTPITVHFKDSSKFKHRKRWSQAMYMQYILNFYLKTFAKHKGRIPPKTQTSLSKASIVFRAPDILMNKDIDFVLERSLSQLDPVKMFDQILETGLPNHNERLDNSGTSYTSNLMSTQKGNCGCKFSEMASHLHLSSDVNLNLDPGNMMPQAPGQLGQFANPDIISDCGHLKIDEEDTYILALDGDIQFEPCSVLELYLGCRSDETVGGVCGRTHPRAVASSGLTVWYQKMDYSFDFWATKSTQNVLGSVTCCPGCFSMFRASALKDVVDTVCQPTRTSADLYLKDIGEDRWITSLMIFKSWNMKYIFNAHNDTYCPASFPELMRQRKRWILSDFANELLLLKRGWWLVRTNGFISGTFLAYTFLLFAWKLQLVSSMIFMMAVSTNLMLGVNFLGCTLVLVAVFILYVVCCLKTAGKTLVRIVLAYGAIFGIACGVNFVYILHYVTEILTTSNEDQPKFFFLMLTLSSGFLLYAACLHPWDLHYLIYLPVYLLYMPAVSMFLPVYSICWIGDQRWGTRDGAADEDDVLSCNLTCRKRAYSSVDDMDDDVVLLDKPAVTTEVISQVQDMESVPALVLEAEFWKQIGQTVLGTDVNKGTDSSALTEDLRHVRKVCLAIYLLVNGVLLLSNTAMYILLADVTQQVARYYFIVFGVITLVKTAIPVVGMTIHHLYTAVRITALTVFGDDFPTWMPRHP